MKRTFKSLILLITLSVLSGCSAYFGYTEYNNEIDATLRNSLKNKSLIFIEDVKNGNEKSYQNILSGEALKAMSTNPDIKNIYKEQFAKENYLLFDEYYNKVTGSAEYITIPAENKKKFVFKNIKRVSDYYYVQFWKSDSLGYQHMLLICYAKEKDDWKIFDFSLGDYSIENLTAPDLVDKSSKFFKEQMYLSSVIYALAARKVMNPLPLLQYDDEKNYTKTIDKVSDGFKDKYHLPMSLDAGNKINLFRITYEITTSGIVPVFEYVTPTGVNNIEAVTEEATVLYPKIQDIFPDIQSSFKYILLRAFNELPTKEGRTYERWGILFRDGKKAVFD